ncbi:MAG: hypothetical protein ACKVI5_03930, partial [Nitrospinaceae bacterium]
ERAESFAEPECISEKPTPTRYWSWGKSGCPFPSTQSVVLTMILDFANSSFTIGSITVLQAETININRRVKTMEEKFFEVIKYDNQPYILWKEGNRS